MRISLLCLIVLFLTGCEFSTHPGESGNGFPFTVELQAFGEFRPNTPVTVVARYRATHAMERARFSLIAPEVEAAKLRNWACPFRVPIGVPLPAFDTISRSVRRGEVIEQRAVLTIPATGVYRIIASGQRESEERYSEPTWTEQSLHFEELSVILLQTGGGVEHRSIGGGGGCLADPPPAP